MVRVLERQLSRHVVRAASISLILMSGTACEDKKESSRLPPPELPERAASGQSQVPGADAADAARVPDQPPPQPSPANLGEPSDEDVDKFVEIQRRLNTLREVMSKRISEGEDAVKVQEAFQKRGDAVVREVGLSPPEYSQFAQLMQDKPDFRRRIKKELREKPVSNTNQNQERTQQE